jgi:hypothetical protein
MPAEPRSQPSAKSPARKVDAVVSVTKSQASQSKAENTKAENTKAGPAKSDNAKAGDAKPKKSG